MRSTLGEFFYIQRAAENLDRGGELSPFEEAMFHKSPDFRKQVGEHVSSSGQWQYYQIIKDMGYTQDKTLFNEETITDVLINPSKENTLIKKADIWLPNVTEELIEICRKKQHLIHELTPRKYEELIAGIFSNNGFDVELTPEKNDGGFDVIAIKKCGLTGDTVNLIECKKYVRKKVGIIVVRGLLGVVNHNKAHKGLIVTTSNFTKPALDFAESNKTKITLKDHDNVLDWLKTLNLPK
ncbi:MAG: restriction endonuclease [Magnetococcales bacterium]|nr:restriction endonuclease [Magnetococcales bacterium]